jgi:hypothetical protein
MKRIRKAEKKHRAACEETEKAVALKKQIANGTAPAPESGSEDLGSDSGGESGSESDGSQGGHDDGMDDEMSIEQRAAKRGGDSRFALPTQQELSHMRDTEDLFRNNLLRLEVKEMVAAVSVNYDKMKSTERLLMAIKSTLELIPEHSVGIDDCMDAFPLRLHTQKEEENMGLDFQPPERFDLVGSYLLRSGIKAELNLDIAVQIPSECFYPKDYLNHRYMDKRALYLSVLAKALSEHPELGSVSAGAFQNDPTKPILVLTPPAKGGKAGGKAGRKLTVRIFPSIAPGLFKAGMLVANHNNVRRRPQPAAAGQQEEAAQLPTPAYNNSLLEDMSFKASLETLNAAKSLSPHFTEACVLAKVWLRQRGMHSQPDGASPFLLSMMLAYLLFKRKGASSMDGIQLFRCLLSFLHETDLTQTVLVIPKTDAALAAGQVLQGPGPGKVHDTAALADAYTTTSSHKLSSMAGQTRMPAVVLLDAAQQVPPSEGAAAHPDAAEHLGCNFAARLSYSGYQELRVAAGGSLRALQGLPPMTTEQLTLAAAAAAGGDNGTKAMEKLAAAEREKGGGSGRSGSAGEGKLSADRSSGFESVFMSKVSFWLAHDLYVWVPALGTLPPAEQRRGASLEQRAADEVAGCGRYWPRRVQQLVSLALGDRAFAVRTHVAPPGEWALGAPPPYSGTGSTLCAEADGEDGEGGEGQALVGGGECAAPAVCLGITLVPGVSTRQLQKGPSADDEAAAGDFRLLWGERSVLRRFADGGITEAVVWTCASGERHLIPEQICKYVLQYHEPVRCAPASAAGAGAEAGAQGAPGDAVKCLGGQLQRQLLVGGVAMVDATPRLLQTFDALKSVLKTLDGMALPVLDVKPVSSEFRYTSEWPPVPHPLAWAKGAKVGEGSGGAGGHDGKREGGPTVKESATAKALREQLKQGAVGTAVQPVRALLVLRPSASWPDELQALRRTKTAFLLHLAKLLTQLTARNMSEARKRTSAQWRAGKAGQAAERAALKKASGTGMINHAELLGGRVDDGAQFAFGCECFVTEDTLDLAYEGYVFRLQLAQPRELHLLQQMAAKQLVTAAALRAHEAAAGGGGDDGGEDGGAVTLASAGAEAERMRLALIEEPALHHQLHAIIGRHPSFGAAVRLAQRWVHSNMFSKHLPARAVEILVAQAYVAPHPFSSAPHAALPALLRFLGLLSTHDWHSNPLVVHLSADADNEAPPPGVAINGELKASVAAERATAAASAVHAQFEAARARGAGAAMFVVAPNAHIKVAGVGSGSGGGVGVDGGGAAGDGGGGGAMVVEGGMGARGVGTAPVTVDAAAAAAALAASHSPAWTQQHPSPVALKRIVARAAETLAALERWLAGASASGFGSQSTAGAACHACSPVVCGGSGKAWRRAFVTAPCMQLEAAAPAGAGGAGASLFDLVLVLRADMRPAGYALTRAGTEAAALKAAASASADRIRGSKGAPLPRVAQFKNLQAADEEPEPLMIGFDPVQR